MVLEPSQNVTCTRLRPCPAPPPPPYLRIWKSNWMVFFVSLR